MKRVCDYKRNCEFEKACRRNRSERVNTFETKFYLVECSYRIRAAMKNVSRAIQTTVVVFVVVSIEKLPTPLPHMAQIVEVFWVAGLRLQSLKVRF